MSLEQQSKKELLYKMYLFYVHIFLNVAVLY